MLATLLGMKSDSIYAPWKKHQFQFVLMSGDTMMIITRFLVRIHTAQSIRLLQVRVYIVLYPGCNQKQIEEDVV